MATKLENYVQMACQTAAEITENREKWTAFLDTASKLYRYQFTDQLLIFAFTGISDHLPKNQTGRSSL